MALSYHIWGWLLLSVKVIVSLSLSLPLILLPLPTSPSIFLYKSREVHAFSLEKKVKYKSWVLNSQKLPFVMDITWKYIYKNGVSLRNKITPGSMDIAGI